MWLNTNEGHVGIFFSHFNRNLSKFHQTAVQLWCTNLSQAQEGNWRHQPAQYTHCSLTGLHSSIYLKKVVNDIFIPTVYEKPVKTMWQRESDEPTENYQLNRQLSSILWSFIVSFSLLFSCPAHNFTVLVHSHRSHCVVFGSSRQVFFLKTRCTLPAQHQNADRWISD